jgi:hypothetical protein
MANVVYTCGGVELREVRMLLRPARVTVLLPLLCA